MFWSTVYITTTHDCPVTKNPQNLFLDMFIFFLYFLDRYYRKMINWVITALAQLIEFT